MSGYDVVGDIHGHADALLRLLRTLGYREVGGAWRHVDRTAVFVGDLVDRGPEQLEVVRIVHRMVEAGSARVVLGNHEFNAIAWATPDGQGGHRRPHTAKNFVQHARFLAAVGDGSPLHHDVLDWFRTMPFWLDLGGLRVVHACWDPASTVALGTSWLTDDHVAAPKGSALYEAVEVVVKGPEIHLGGAVYLDKDGHPRRKARHRWWHPDATTLRTAAEIPAGAVAEDGSPFPALPDHPVPPGLPGAPTDVPVLYGHYWRPGRTHSARVDDGGMSACLDWSVAAGGALVAYRWDGEDTLTDDHLVAVPSR